MYPVFFVDSDDCERQIVEKLMVQEGCRIFSYASLKDAERLPPEASPDLCILEMTHLDDGVLEFTRRAQEGRAIPIILFSALDERWSRSAALEAGALECLAKPLSPRELILRIRTALRLFATQSIHENTGPLWRLDSKTLQMDLGSHQATIDGQSIPLTASEWRILTYLCAQGGKVVTREKILVHCLDSLLGGYDRRVDTHVKNLRRRLGSSCWIETVRGYGYRFLGESDAGSNQLAENHSLFRAPATQKETKS